MKKYTVKEVANLLEISEYRVRKLIHTGWIRAERGPRRAFMINEIALFDYAIHGAKYRNLLRTKIGPGFIVYMSMYDIHLTIRNAEYFKRIIKEHKEKRGLEN